MFNELYILNIPGKGGRARRGREPLRKPVIFNITVRLEKEFVLFSSFARFDWKYKYKYLILIIQGESIFSRFWGS